MNALVKYKIAVVVGGHIHGKPWGERQLVGTSHTPMLLSGAWMYGISMAVEFGKSSIRIGTIQQIGGIPTLLVAWRLNITSNGTILAGTYGNTALGR